MVDDPIEILLVDDEPADVELTRTALTESKLPVNVSVAWNGVEALNYLQQIDESESISRPHLILLDLNMPKMSGIELLAVIKNDERYRDIPVVVLSTSDAERDIAETYAQGANCYVTKPVGFYEFVEVLHSVENFWFSTVKLPPR